MNLDPDELVKVCGFSKDQLATITRAILKTTESEADRCIPSIFASQHEATKRYTSLNEDERLDFKRFLMIGFLRETERRVGTIGKSK